MVVAGSRPSTAAARPSPLPSQFRPRSAHAHPPTVVQRPGSARPAPTPREVLLRRIFDAAALGNEATLRELVMAPGASVDYQHPRGGGSSTPLCAAISAGHAACAAVLLGAHASLEMADSHGRTPLGIACTMGSVGTARMLLRAGACPNGAELDPAIKQQHLRRLQRRIERDAGAASPGPSPRGSPPPDVSGSRSPTVGSPDSPEPPSMAEGTKVLDEPLTPPSSRAHSPPPTPPAAPQPTPPLCIACAAGHVAIVRLLLEASASVDVTDECGLSPLHIAARAGHVDAISALLEKREAISIDRGARGDETALYMACEAGARHAAGLLIAASATLDAPTSAGVTPLHVAARRGRGAVVSALLAAGADPNAAATDGGTPLFAACDEGHGAIAARLLDARRRLRARVGLAAARRVRARRCASRALTRWPRREPRSTRTRRRDATLRCGKRTVGAADRARAITARPPR